MKHAAWSCRAHLPFEEAEAMCTHQEVPMGVHLQQIPIQGIKYQAPEEGKRRVCEPKPPMSIGMAWLFNLPGVFPAMGHCYGGVWQPGTSQAPAAVQEDLQQHP